VDYAQDIAFCWRSIGTKDKVRTTKGVKVYSVVGAVEGRVEHFSDFLYDWCRFDVEEYIQGFSAGHVVSFGANTTYAVGDAWHFFSGTTHRELFEAAQFRDLEIGVLNIPFLIEEDFDLAMAFKPRDGINCDSFHGAMLLSRFR
jgi:hypothetical protein